MTAKALRAAAVGEGGILMTTATTIFGLTPLGGGGMWSSMAYAMMFGLGFATVLTLLLCPTLFYLFFREREPKAPKEKKPTKGKKTSEVADLAEG